MTLDRLGFYCVLVIYKYVSATVSVVIYILAFKILMKGNPEKRVGCLMFLKSVVYSIFNSKMDQTNETYFH